MILAQFVNAALYDNGQQLQDMLQANAKTQWLLALVIGVELFIAFSSRFNR